MIARSPHRPVYLRAARRTRVTGIAAAAALTSVGALLVFGGSGSLHGTASTAKPAPTLEGLASHAAAGASLAALPEGAGAPVSSALGREDSSYRITSSRGRFTADNAANALRARFDRLGVHVTTRKQSLTLALTGLGYGSHLGPVGSAAPEATSNRVAYRLPDLSEWFVNGPLGLEQGFSLRHRPVGAGTGPLTFALSVTGSLARQARLVNSGTGVQFGALVYRDLVVTDAAGKRLSARFDRSEGRLLIHVADKSARYPLRVDPTVQAAKLTASIGAAGDWLGYSVAVSGDTIAVGAPSAESGDGAVYVFTKTGAGWTDANETAELTATDGNTGDGLGSSVAIDGTTIVAGAPYAGDEVSGAVYVFDEPGGWASGPETAELTASDDGDGLGTSVGIDGGTIVAGAPEANNGVGAVYLYAEPGGGWTDAMETAQLTADDGTAGDALGSSVAISGGTVAAGAPFAGESSSSVGAVYVFTQPAGDWTTATQDVELTASGGAGNGDGIGWSVAVDGDTVAAGAPYADVNGNAVQGAAYVFEKPGGGWADANNETVELSAADGASSDALGWSVSVSGSSVAAGAPYATVDGNTEQGTVYLFTESGGDWTAAAQSGEWNASDGTAGDTFGSSVALGGGTVVAGAPTATVDGTPGQGAAYVASEPLCQPGTYSASGSAPCTDADPGSFVDHAGATSQTPCAAGTYQPNSGRTSCLDAPAGTSVANQGAATPTPCDSGSYQDATGQTACKPAPPGTFTLKASGAQIGPISPTPCAAGTYQPNSGQSSCLPAGRGFYVSSAGSATETACPGGETTAGTGATSVAACGSAPAITSASSAVFRAGSAGTFTVKTTGSGTISLTRLGGLPIGVTFHDNGDGTATLAGTPAAGTGGHYPLTITAANAFSPNANQSFSLAVAEPSVVAAAVTAPNGNGWYNGPVVVHFSCTDPGSTVATCPADLTLSSEGAAVSSTAAVMTDAAGFSATSNVVTMQIDRTAPTITFAGNAGTYGIGSTVSITCAAADGLSGVASSTCPTISAPAWSLGAGLHTLSGTATDKAGNTGTGSTTFTVTVNSADLCTLNTQFVDSSNKYQALLPVQRLVVNVLVKSACTILTSVGPKLLPNQKAPFINAYDQAVQALVAPGWLTQTQANTLTGLAAAL